MYVPRHPFCVWRLTSPVPSLVTGVLLGPFCANLINVSRWSHDDEEGEIAYVSCDRVDTSSFTTDGNRH